MQRGPPAVQSPVQNSPMQCDCSYFGSWSGIFKIVQVLSSLIAFFCLHYISIQNCGGCDIWFQIASMSGIIVSTVFLFLYFLHLIETCDNIPWLKIECVSSILWTIFNLSAAAKMASIYCYNLDYHHACSKATAATVFGFIAMIAYACDAGLQLYRIMRRIPAQG